jgi:hypothetical protein
LLHVKIVKIVSVSINILTLTLHVKIVDRLCGLVVLFLATDPEARVRFPALPEKKVVGIERIPLSLVTTTEELLDRKVADPVYKTENTAGGIRHADHVASSIRTSWPSLRR